MDRVGYGDSVCTRVQYFLVHTPLPNTQHPIFATLGSGNSPRLNPPQDRETRPTAPVRGEISDRDGEEGAFHLSEGAGYISLTRDSRVGVREHEHKQQEFGMGFGI